MLCERFLEAYVLEMRRASIFGTMKRDVLDHFIDGSEVGFAGKRIAHDVAIVRWTVWDHSKDWSKKNVKKIGTVVLMATWLSGCATTAGYEALLQSWVGDSTDHLVSAWGVPQQQWLTSNGGKILQYERSGQIVLPGVTTYQPVATTYTNGTVSGYGSNGNFVNGSYDGTSTTYARQTSAPTVIQQRCVSRFTADAQGQITNWAWEGNSCRAMARKQTAQNVPMIAPVSKDKAVNTGRCTAARNLCAEGNSNCASYKKEFDAIGFSCPGINAPVLANK